MQSHPLGEQLTPVSEWDYGMVEREVGIYYREKHKLSPMSQLFVEFCDRHFDDRVTDSKSFKSKLPRPR